MSVPFSYNRMCYLVALSLSLSLCASVFLFSKYPSGSGRLCAMNERWGICLHNYTGILSSNYRCRGRWNHDCVVERGCGGAMSLLYSSEGVSLNIDPKDVTLFRVYLLLARWRQRVKPYIGCAHWSVAHSTIPYAASVKMYFQLYPCNAPALFMVFIDVCVCVCVGWCASLNVCRVGGGEFSIIVVKRVLQCVVVKVWVCALCSLLTGY